MNTTFFQESLRTQLLFCGLSLPSRTLDLLARHYDLMHQWNTTHNLTRVSVQDRAIALHYVDCLLGLETISAELGPVNYDLGSGAGFPGIVAGAWSPDRRFVLVESTRKKCSFLRLSASELKLTNLQIYEGRVETISDIQVALSRAAFSLSHLSLLAPRFAIGGKLLLWLSENQKLELQELKKAPFKIEGFRTYQMPDGTERCIGVLVK